jgi:Flp pilus assembly protein TadG
MAFLRRLLCDGRGAAAVEFGLLAPVLVVVLAGVAYVATLTLKTNAMHAAVSSGAQYVMAGGSDLGVAQQVVASAWPGRTAGASVSAVKVCRCGTAAATCTVLCADQSVPQAFVVLTGADQVTIGTMAKAISTTEEVRVR